MESPDTCSAADPGATKGAGPAAATAPSAEPGTTSSPASGGTASDTPDTAAGSLRPAAARPSRPSRTGRPSRTAAGPGAAAFVPAGADVSELAAAAAECRGCELAELPETRTVFGEGRPDAWMVLVGEQPGDVEDRRGRPFVGPAGKLLDRALAEVGLDRDELYVTNAVKHFRYRRGSGPRRIHQTPEARHVTACRPWLSAELNRIRPSVVVVLGATAGSSLLGPQFRVTKMRGRLLDGPPGSGARLLATLHPSAVLRADPSIWDEMYAGFVADLRIAVTARPGTPTRAPGTGVGREPGT